MDTQIRQLVHEAIDDIINDTVSDANVKKSRALHSQKIHFVPVQYRIIGGLLQSLNIKFGNFIERLIALVVDHDVSVSALPASGKKIPLEMTAETDTLIDGYITSRQLPSSVDNCDKVFHNLLESILENERNSELPKQRIKKDIDALFRTSNGQIIYLEIKYNDDHDTGKFVDINRKFLKTYAGLVNYLEITTVNDLKPILYYFNPVKRWGPIYVPSKNIYRGRQLFDEFFAIPFVEIDDYLRELGTDQNMIEIFDRLYERIRHDG